MAHTRVTDADLRAYLDSGHSQAEAARHFGVSEPAVHQRLKRMRALTSQVIALAVCPSDALPRPAVDRNDTGAAPHAVKV